MTGCVCLEVAIGHLAATQLEQNAEFVTLAALSWESGSLNVFYCVNGFCADYCHNRAPFVLVVVVTLFMVPVFTCFFQKFPSFCGQMCGLGLNKC